MYEIEKPKESSRKRKVRNYVGSRDGFEVFKSNILTKVCCQKHLFASNVQYLKCLVARRRHAH